VKELRIGRSVASGIEWKSYPILTISGMPKVVTDLLDPARAAVGLGGVNGPARVSHSASAGSRAGAERA
jgi:hypothetical protein